MEFNNPILTGFHPDPSIVRNGDTYYMACSTFEWFPGVVIYSSQDLHNWRLVSRPLDSLEKLNIVGVPDSCGVWAPCLTYARDQFYLVYSQVRSFDGMWKDTPNFLITSDNIEGPWSSPIFLSASGFDGSMYHEGDRSWYLSMLIDHRDAKFFGGITIQEYDRFSKKLLGIPQLIFEGSELGITEGPHIYKLNGYYYLLTAEGGTEYGHAISIARSRNLYGPYELHPENPILSSKDNPNHPLQKTGHGSFVWDETGICYLSFLCGRPFEQHGRCILGRETGIEAIKWKNDWPYLMNETRLAGTGGQALTRFEEWVDFSDSRLPDSYHSLRIPMEETWLNYDDGQLVLSGRDSLSSCFYQSLVARRIQHFKMRYSCKLEYSPDSFQQMAGLVCYYNTGHHYYLYVTCDNEADLILNLVCVDNFNHIDYKINIPLASSSVELKVELNYKTFDFYYRQNSEKWLIVKSNLDSTILSDDYVREGDPRYRAAFTGSFVGVATQDFLGTLKPAHFNYLKYETIEDE